MSSATPNGKATSALPLSKPIDILPSALSRYYAHLQPILLLSLLIVHFDRLVANPVPTLLTLAALTAPLQTLYCILCLPISGATPSPPPKPGQKKKPSKPAQDLLARIVVRPSLLSLLLTAFLTTPLLYTTLVLFGAPLTTHQFETALLALHLALLTTPQLYYTHGLDTTTWFKILSLQLPVDEILGMSMGACVGAWMGAVPIPLDWDREWQRWPVTVVVGGYVGAVVGKAVGGLICKGWRMKLS